VDAASDDTLRSPLPIFLVGMMGAGKSTLGHALAGHLRCAFIDLDLRIERLWGRTIGELFVEGEPAFRRRERAALVSLLREPGFTRRRSVIATGGGVLTTPGSRELLDAGHVVYLAVSAERLVERLSSAGELSRRPLLSGLRADQGQGVASDLAHPEAPLLALVRGLLDARRPGYESADLEVDAAAPTSDVLAAILSLITPPAAVCDAAPPTSP
jgi:shikimate kinase